MKLAKHRKKMLLSSTENPLEGLIGCGCLLPTLVLVVILLIGCGSSFIVEPIRLIDSGWQLRIKMTVWDESDGISWCLLPLTEKGVVVTAGHEVAFSIFDAKIDPPTEHNVNCQEITWSVKICDRYGELIPPDGKMLWIGDFWRLPEGQYRATATIADIDGKTYRPFETLIVAVYDY